MKKCPYCAEEIQDEAIKCRYCGSDLRIPPPEVTPQSLVVPQTPVGSDPSRKDQETSPAATSTQTVGTSPGPSAEAEPPATRPEPGLQAEPTPQHQPGPPAPRVGEGAISFSHSGYRYILGYGADFFGIWDRQVPGGPVSRFPRTDDGWDEAWNAFVAWEPKSVEVPRTGLAPDVRTSSQRFASASARANWAVALIGLASLLALVSAGMWAAHIGTLRDFQHGVVTRVQAQDSENRAAGLESSVFFVMAGAAIAWLMWQHRAQSNLRALGAQGLRFTPGWAVGWWFVPFANIVMPYRTMSELWRASVPNAGAVDWKATSATPLLALWWAAWLSRIVLSSIGASVGRNDDVHSLIARSGWYVAADVVLGLAGLLSIWLVRGVQRRQTEKRERMREWSQGFAAAS